MLNEQVSRENPVGIIALTGASGFIGRHFVGAARKRGWTLRLLSRAGGGANQESRAFDLAGTEPLDPGLLDGCCAVIHLASHIPVNQGDPAEAETCFRLNALGTIRLLECARRAGVKRFVHTVSANAYRPDLIEPSEDAQMLPTRRAPFYLTSKVAQEVFAGYFGTLHGFSVLTLRLSSVFGPDSTNVASKFARALARGETVRLADAGTFGTDLVVVDDVVLALVRLTPSDTTGPVNVGSGVRTTLRELAEELVHLIGADSAQVALDPPDRTSDGGFPALDVARLRRYGLPPTSLRDGLRAMVQSGPATRPTSAETP